MLIDPKKSLFVPINLQTLMLDLVQDKDSFIRNNRWLISMAHDLDIPILPVIHKGLQDLIPQIKEKLGDVTCMEKANFSCAREGHILSKIKEYKRKQIIISGMEAHVCVMHTAFELKKEGYDVFVVRNAITARNKEDIEAAIDRLNANGVTVITKEMLMFEGLERTDTEKYKQISTKYFHTAEI